MASRLTIRARLTLWYSAVFAVTAAAVLTVMYLLVRRAFFTAGDGIVATLRAVPAEAGQPVTVAPPGIVQETLPLVAAATTATRTDALRTIVLETGATFAVLAAVSLGLCWLVAGRALRPLRQITDTAAALSHENLDARIGLHGPRDEIRALAGTFDAMLDRLNQAFQAQQLFVANASHELRTPLTIIRTAAEMALSRPVRSETEYRQALSTVAAAAERSDTTLAGLLSLALLRRDGRHAEHVDLADLTASATDTPVVLRLEPAPCTVDGVQVRLLLRNLLDNAARYNKPGGEVLVTTGVTGGEAWLRVDNTGPVIDPGDIPALRHPFQRGAGRTGGDTGAGLGLAIVDAVAAANDGRCDITARAGGGLSVTVAFPAAIAGFPAA